MIPIHVVVPRDIREQIEQIAAIRNTSMGDVCREAIRNGLAQI
jgi:hypothetical protein